MVGATARPLTWTQPRLEFIAPAIRFAVSDGPSHEPHCRQSCQLSPKSKTLGSAHPADPPHCLALQAALQAHDWQLEAAANALLNQQRGAAAGPAPSRSAGPVQQHSLGSPVLRSAGGSMPSSPANGKSPSGKGLVRVSVAPASPVWQVLGQEFCMVAPAVMACCCGTLLGLLQRMGRVLQPCQQLVPLGPAIDLGECSRRSWWNLLGPSRCSTWYTCKATSCLADRLFPCRSIVLVPPIGAAPGDTRRLQCAC